MNWLIVEEQIERKTWDNYVRLDNDSFKTSYNWSQVLRNHDLFVLK